MSPGELAKCLEERWIARYGLVQQIDRFQKIRLCVTASGWSKAHSQKKIFGPTIEIKGGEIHCGWPLNSQTFSGRNIEVKLLCDLLRDLALHHEHVFEVEIVFFRPDVRISAGVDQLRVYVKPRPGLAHAAFQHVRNTKSVSDLARVLFVAISHNAGPADDLESCNLGKLGQKVVLDTISKRGVLSVITQVFKGQHRDARY